jgi:hypothetical protein
MNTATTHPAPTVTTVTTYRYDLRSPRLVLEDVDGRPVRLGAVEVEIDGGCLEVMTYGWFLTKAGNEKGNRHSVYIGSVFEETYAEDARRRHFPHFAR